MVAVSSTEAEPTSALFTGLVPEPAISQHRAGARRCRKPCPCPLGWVSSLHSGPQRWVPTAPSVLVPFSPAPPAGPCPSPLCSLQGALPSALSSQSPHSLQGSCPRFTDEEVRPRQGGRHALGREAASTRLNPEPRLQTPRSGALSQEQSRHSRQSLPLKAPDQTTDSQQPVPGAPEAEVPVVQAQGPQ